MALSAPVGDKEQLGLGNRTEGRARTPQGSACLGPGEDRETKPEKPQAVQLVALGAPLWEPEAGLARVVPSGARREGSTGVRCHSRTLAPKSPQQGRGSSGPIKPVPLAAGSGKGPEGAWGGRGRPRDPKMSPAELQGTRRT